MPTANYPRPGSDRRRGRRRLMRPVTVLAAFATVAGLAAGWAAPASAAPGRAVTPAAPAAVTAAGAPAGPKRLKPVVRTAVRHDTSPPLGKLKPLRKMPSRKIKTVPLPATPHAIGTTDKTGTAGVQRAATVTTNDMPAFQQNFDGQGNLDGVLPPDTNMAVGPNDIVQTVNLSFAVYNKQGNTLYGPVSLGTLWQGFGGQCDPGADPYANGGDPIVLYDEKADRWIITQLAYPASFIGSGGYHECIAVSQTGDPTGAWYRYDFLASQDTLNDYPKLGVWPDAYYMSSNGFLNGQRFTGVTVTAFDRAQMLAGQQATQVSFTLGNQYSSLLPSNAEGGAIGQNPPPGAPDPFFMSCDAANGGPCSSDQMDEWDFHVDWANPAASTFGDNGAPTTTIPVAAFDSNLCDYSFSCIPQPGQPTALSLDPLSDRLMYQSAYRNLGGGTQAVVLNQTVNVSTSGGNQAGVRWYELTNTGSGWGLGQQGTYAPDSDNRWMGSANIDASGDIAVGYSVSSATTYPSIRVAGRLAGELSQGEETMMAGEGSQTDPSDRWGDYSAMQVDPTGGCTFWYTSEYLPGTVDRSWQTRIGSFKFPSCTTGAHGNITGTVTDSSTGKPVAGATVSTSAGSTTTDSQGRYDLVLPAGRYDVTFHAFGYTDKTGSGIQVTGGGTATDSEALAPVPTVHVTGTVTDGSGHGWPLHASIAITGRPGGPVWTNPATGAYRVDLPENATYQLGVSTDVPGYQTVRDTVTVGSSDLTHNISVPVDATTCNAPGYQFNYGTAALNENFDDYPGDGGTTPPPGWTITDNEGNGQVWRFDNPGGWGNQTGGSGNFAMVNSGAYPFGDTQDTSLVTPVLDLSGEATPILKFHTDILYGGIPGQQAESVDVSTDGGQTWTTVWHHANDSIPGPDLETVPLPQAGGKSGVQLRFHYSATEGEWWQVDDVTVLNCDPVPGGGLVVGKVTDANTGNGINGASVTSTDNPSDKAVTAASADPAIGNGYYWLFSSLTGSHPLTAAKPSLSYSGSSQTVNVASDGTTQAGFSLKAGRLAITPGSIQTSQLLGTTTKTTMTIKNTGTAPADVKLVQQGGNFQVRSARGAPLRRVPLAPGGQATPALAHGKQGSTGPGVNAAAPADSTWSTIAPYPTTIMNNAADIIDGKVYSVGGLNGDTFTGGEVLSNGFVYDPVQDTWSSIAAMPVARDKPAAAAVNGKLYVTGGAAGRATPIAETDVYNPATNSWSTLSPNPDPTTAAGVAVVGGKIYLVGGCTSDDLLCSSTANVEVYDPATDSWSAAAPYPHPVNWETCGGINGKVYCAGGAAGSTSYADGYVYDPGSNSWSPIAGLPSAVWGSAGGAANGLLVVSGGLSNFSVTNQGYAYDPTTNSWTAIPNAQYPVYLAGSSCGFYEIGGSPGGINPTPDSEMLSGLGDCATADNTTVIPWMAENPTTATLQPGQSISVTVTLSATTAGKVTQPGAYTAQIGFDQDTPYEVSPEDVTMNVTPPKGWGKIGGTLSGENCSQVTAPLPGVVRAIGGKGISFTLPTGTDGSYAFWAPADASPFTLTASANGWLSQTAKASIRAGKTTTVNFTLRPASC